MCLIKGEKVKIAKKDIPVWKVFEIKHSEYLLLFRSVTGYEYRNITTRDRLSAKLSLVIRNKSWGFDSGYGFHSFKNLNLATSYKESISRNGTRRYAIKKLIIPEGTKYENGMIDYGLLGSGMIAIRSEYLKEPKGEKIDSTS